ncbi:kinase-like protein [Mycena alexandri]|uniref:Kinase-like protein n=1 Tax=Mycena alexandri TaxID=1745969 RepID=A0AAD6T2R2_9AGAR|nr:kinase-like protein [Mycena alexandri]
MLSAPALDLTFDDDSDGWPSQAPRLYHRPASVGNSWGVTSIGRGFDWDADPAEPRAVRKENLGGNSPLAFDLPPSDLPPRRSYIGRNFDWNGNTAGPAIHRDSKLDTPPLAFDLQPELPRRLLDVLDTSQVMRPVTSLLPAASITNEPFSYSPSNSRPPSPHYFTASGRASPLTPTIPSRPPMSRSPTMPQRPRRRSSQQRISLIAGRISIATIEPPDPVLPQGLLRANSTSSLLSLASSTRAPSPVSSEDSQTFIGGRDISEFVIEAEIGRGAYGLVKRAREISGDGSLGPPLIIKQIIKSRILADCWKKHPKHGTIPIEIYVMSSISQTSYVLPPRRPWDPTRADAAGLESHEWVEGSIVNGHPNICPLLDFFEDNHYYYLVLPSTLPELLPDQPAPPSDLFDLVENFPQGLPPASIRSYLGQLADALAFLHSRGIVHRDVKDENVVLGPNGKCILIDFGSSGLVKRGGWDTFSGTLDYAGPEILRGERYEGKEQDVWAFGVVAYVLLVGECPFMTPAEAQDGLDSPFANASIALDERCGEDHERDGEEADGGGALEDAAALVRACLNVEVAGRPSFEKILQSRFLAGMGGWSV